MKKGLNCFVVVLVSLLLLVGIMGQQIPAEAAEHEGIIYRIRNGEVIVYGYRGSAAELVIPAEIEWLPVTTIEEEAFRECTSLTSVVIPDSVTTIGNRVFYYCTNLVSVNIPKGISRIPNDMFGCCENLTNIVIPNNITAIGRGAFAFCDSLDEIRIPSSVTTIEDSAFMGCTSLTAVEIPDTVTALEGGVFSQCSGLTDVELPQNLTAIPASFFYGCTGLTQVDIPKNVTQIGDYAFDECIALSRIELPEGVTYIGSGAFRGCSSLTELEIPDKVTTIGDSAFQASGLTSIRIPYGVTAIEQSLFLGCVNLEKVTVPYTVTTIGYSAFANCYSLRQLIIPGKVTRIEDHAFNNCDALTSLVIPATVEYVGEYAFAYCDNLRKLEFRGNAPEFRWKTFSGGVMNIYYPGGNNTWTDAVESDYWDCDITWIPWNADVTVAGANMVLGSTLDMNFFVDKTTLTGTNYYAQIIHYAADGVSAHIIYYPMWDIRENHAVVTLEGLAARQMTDQVEVTIYTTDGVPVSVMWADSIRDYAMRILDKQNAETKTLLVDMLNYGAAAQTYFGYCTGDLANAFLTDAQKAYATGAVSCPDHRVKGSNYFGSTLTLKSRILLTMYFKNINPDMYAMVSYTDHKGNYHDLYISGSKFIRYNDETYGVEVDDLVVADGNQLVTVRVYDASGKQVAWASDSMNSYAGRMMASDALFEAVAKFTTSAYAYFH